MGPIVLATGNPHKVEELRAIFGAAGIAVIGLRDLPGHERFEEPHEHGRTCEENAAIKALSYAGQTGRTCLADDSGLEIDALGGRPGVISSHYSTDGRETGLAGGRDQRDRANNARVLRELDGVPPDRRTARFVCVMALAEPGRILAIARGTFDGRIGVPPDVPRGDRGFGYDPLFLVADGRTSAELPAHEKNLLSHRAAAARAMLRELADLKARSPQV
jgi:XTP/dITP diphosphohydrolase